MRMESRKEKESDFSTREPDTLTNPSRYTCRRRVVLSYFQQIDWHSAHQASGIRLILHPASPIPSGRCGGGGRWPWNPQSYLVMVIGVSLAKLDFFHDGKDRSSNSICFDLESARSSCIAIDLTTLTLSTRKRGLISTATPPSPTHLRGGGVGAGGVHLERVTT